MSALCGRDDAIASLVRHRAASHVDEAALPIGPSQLITDGDVFHEDLSRQAKHPFFSDLCLASNVDGACVTPAPAAHESFFLDARPLLDLRLAMLRERAIQLPLFPNEPNGMARRCVARPSSRVVLRDSALEIGSNTGIETSVRAAQQVAIVESCVDGRSIAGIVRLRIA